MGFVKKYRYYILALIFILTLAIKLIFAFQSPYFNDGSSYLTLRHVEHIKETGTPLFKDELSYGGRTSIFMPFFYYLLSFLNLFVPLTLVAKVIPNILISSLVIIVYFLSMELTKNEEASLFSSFIIGFAPIFFQKTINDISPYSIAIPLTFYILFCFMKIEKVRCLYQFLLLFLLLALIHSSVLILASFFLVYLVLIKLESFKQKRAELEAILFSTFLVLWLYFVIYKKAFLLYGPLIVWQNTPHQILGNIFAQTNLLQAIYQIGALPLLYGIYAIYNNIFHKGDRRTYLLIAFAFSIVILLWTKLIQPQTGYMYLAVIMALFFAQFYKTSFQYIKKTRFSKYRALFFFSIVFVFLITSMIPSFVVAWKVITEKTPSEDDIKAFEWIKENTNKGDVILTSVEKGHLITYFTGRKNVADTNFLLIDDVDEIYSDITKIYTTPFETEAVKLLNKYTVSYIYVSEKIKRDFNIDEIFYISDKKCFRLEYNSAKIQIYKLKCELK